MQSNTKLFAENKISAICFSPNASSVAVAFKSNNVIHIYSLPHDICLVDHWILKSVIKEQTQQICALDWSSKDKIISCSHDRSVVVWRK
jgi:WD40 repeat protein